MMSVISLGLGVQSTALYLMSSSGLLKRADYAIFADPGAELPETYNVLKRLKKWQKENDGIPILVSNEKNLLEDLRKKENSSGNKWASIPAYTGEKGIVRRQCTNEYKIRPVIKKIREIYGLKPKYRMPMTEVWLGISMDEIQRVKTSTLKRVTYYYPLVENRLSRKDCISFFKGIGFKVPPKSSCVFCPYHSDSSWRYIKNNCKKSWDLALEVDDIIRNISGDSIKEKLYLYYKRKPLKDVDFDSQQELFMCEEGFCGL